MIARHWIQKGFFGQLMALQPDVVSGQGLKAKAVRNMTMITQLETSATVVWTRHGNVLGRLAAEEQYFSELTIVLMMNT